MKSRHYSYLLFALGIGLLSFPAYSRHKEEWPKQFSSEEHCVAYKTKKTIMLISRAIVFGKNCSMKISLLDKKEGQFVQIDIPVSEFHSGEKARDEAVPELLGINKEGSIFFTTQLPKKLNSLGDHFTINGNLQIGDKAHNLSIPVTNKNDQFTGSVTTSFTQLGLEVPSVGGGIVAKVEDRLELLFQFKKDQLVQSSN